MSVLVDTSVWSIGLRRKFRDLNPTERQIYFEWESILKRGDADIIGPIRQEVLSGIATPDRFTQVRARLAMIPDLHIPQDTYILAAEFYNTCRSHGISPEAIDMTICAAAHTHHTPIFTTDPDFPRYAKHLPITLHRIK